MRKSSKRFPTSTKGLSQARSLESVELPPGGRFDLRIGPVAKRLGDSSVRMLAYNGSIPGPTLWVRQGSELVVDVVNDGDLEATVHWHGLRLDNLYDGTPQTQAPIPMGGRFTYRLAFPDPGVYWYHPHVREDYTQEMGLYGMIVVVPSQPDYWPMADREVALALDDVLLQDGKIAPFSRKQASHVAMGRFGNVMLANGETDLALSARRGDVVRFYVVNTANARVFNVALPGARMKLVGGDSGRCEHERIVENVMLAPSERAVVDVLFSAPGRLTLEHRSPKRIYPLAAITVAAGRATAAAARRFDALRADADLAAERKRVASALDAEPDKRLGLVAEMNLDAPEAPSAGTVVYVCPMHPEVASHGPGRCPKCGMKLLAKGMTEYACPMHPDVRSERPERCPKCGMKLVQATVSHAAGEHSHAGAHGGYGDHGVHGEHHEHDEHGGHDMHDMHDEPESGNEADGTEREDDGEAEGIEWEDDMVDINRMTTTANTRWKLVDRATGAEGAAIDWRFKVGDRVKIRVINEMDSDHPMHHPFHIHGAGRFLVLARDGAVETNLVWKDTVLVRTGETVDLLLDVTNPGVWMAHCHIAEHHESGMMFSFRVDP